MRSKMMGQGGGDGTYLLPLRAPVQCKQSLCERNISGRQLGMRRYLETVETIITINISHSHHLYHCLPS